LGWMKNNFYADSWWKFDCSRHNMFFKHFLTLKVFWDFDNLGSSVEHNWLISLNSFKMSPPFLSCN
jgi:hypothetical protein